MQILLNNCNRILWNLQKVKRRRPALSFEHITTSIQTLNTNTSGKKFLPQTDLHRRHAQSSSLLSLDFSLYYGTKFQASVCGNFRWKKWHWETGTRWFKYDGDWFLCKQAALRSSCATLREWSHNLHPPSCSG